MFLLCVICASANGRDDCGTLFFECWARCAKGFAQDVISRKREVQFDASSQYKEIIVQIFKGEVRNGPTRRGGPMC